MRDGRAMGTALLRRALRLAIAAAGIAAVCGSAVVGAEGERDTRRKKVLIVGIDGLRPDALLAARAPNLSGLRAEGVFCAAARTGDATVSGPGWSSLLTGVWRDKHGVDDNKFEGSRLDAYPCFFKRVKEKRPGVVTASFVSWEMLEKRIIESSGADIRHYKDHREVGDGPAAEAAAECLAKRDPDLVFVYFARVDSVGHAHGFHPSVPEYLAEIERTDALIGTVLRAVRGRSSYAKEDWLVLVSTDHGGTLDGKHGKDVPEHRTIFLLAAGDSVARGEWTATANQVDVPVTAMAHLGIEPDPSWGMDGRPFGSAAVPPFGENLLYNGDAERSAPAEANSVNRGVAGWTDTGGMTVIAYGSPKGFPDARTRGPRTRGRAFFSGGNDGDSEISQRVDLRRISGEVDAAGVSFELSAWLGGYREQRDLAWVVARFRDERGGLLLESAIGPVTLEDRRREIGGKDEDLTGLLPRDAKGTVPAGTRNVEVVLEAKLGTGNTDGYADDISLVLRRAK